MHKFALKFWLNMMDQHSQRSSSFEEQNHQHFFLTINWARRNKTFCRYRVSPSACRVSLPWESFNVAIYCSLLPFPLIIYICETIFCESWILQEQILVPSSIQPISDAVQFGSHGVFIFCCCSSSPACRQLLFSLGYGTPNGASRREASEPTGRYRTRSWKYQRSW